MNGNQMWKDATPHLWDALKMIVVTGLVGGLLVWKNSAVLETKFDHLCVQVNKIETTMEKLGDRLERHILFGDKKLDKVER